MVDYIRLKNALDARAGTLDDRWKSEAAGGDGQSRMG